jgi:hypothetical protein
MDHGVSTELAIVVTRHLSRGTKLYELPSPHHQEENHDTAPVSRLLCGVAVPGLPPAVDGRPLLRQLHVRDELLDPLRYQQRGELELAAPGAPSLILYIESPPAAAVVPPPGRHSRSAEPNCAAVAGVPR